MTRAWSNTTTAKLAPGNLTDDQSLTARAMKALDSPVPQHCWFDHIESTWEGAGRFAERWRAPLSGSVESRWMILNANQLVQAIILHVRLAYAPSHQHLYTVKHLIEAEAEHPGLLFAAMRQSPDAQVAQEARRAQENQSNPWFGGLRQALFCVRISQL